MQAYPKERCLGVWLEAFAPGALSFSSSIVRGVFNILRRVWWTGLDYAAGLSLLELEETYSSALSWTFLQLAQCSHWARCLVGHLDFAYRVMTKPAHSAGMTLSWAVPLRKLYCILHVESDGSFLSPIEEESLRPSLHHRERPSGLPLCPIEVHRLLGLPAPVHPSIQGLYPGLHINALNLHMKSSRLPPPAHRLPLSTPGWLGGQCALNEVSPFPSTIFQGFF